MTTVTIGNTITRPLLPLVGTRGVPTRELVKLFRWVTWVVDPCTPEMASGHLAVYPDGCVVRARRGPKGGWLGARFLSSGSHGALVEMQAKGWLLHLGRIGRT